MTPLVTARVAEVVVRRGAKAGYGSGYRITSRLILTAGHVLDVDGDADVVTSFEIRLGGTDVQLPARQAWRSAEHDLALLRLDDSATIDPVPPVAFGLLPDDVGSILFVAIGFPAYAFQGETADRQGLRQRDSRRISGSVQLGSNLKSGLLDLALDPAGPSDRMGEPWQGMSGAAVFTGDDGLLIGVQAARLPRAGTANLQGEPIARVLQDPGFLEALGGDGESPRSEQIALPGAPPANTQRAVLPQQQLVDGFSTFKKNLTADGLPFVSPGADHPAYPSLLFDRLKDKYSGGRGVLLVGAAGTGKTRTGIEVGNVALAAGWRVLHVVPSDDDGTLEEIIGRVFAERSSVLVVIDYFNESRLDPVQLRKQLIAEANRRKDMQVAILASMRPGGLQRADRALLHQLFDEVELRQDDSFQRLVAENALRQHAPGAIEQLGMRHMMRICGRRPIIALLIARGIEHQVQVGKPLPEGAALRSGGELSGWLESRLREDGLTVAARETAFGRVRASSELLAAAAAAAACPQPRYEVTAAAQASLDAAAGSAPTAEDADLTAEDVVATLISWGWLEQHEGVVSVAHDVVADQLMESVLLPERGIEPDAVGTRALLDGCLTDPRTIGRFAVNVGRLANDLDLAKRSAAVTPVLDDWFADNATVIGQILRRSSRVGGHALGALFAGSLWSDSAVRCWEEAVGPWLADYGGSVHARYLLSSCLHPLSPASVVRPLIPTGLAWIGEHWRLPEAGFVLASLLERDDLPPQAAQETVAVALSWLERHPVAAEAWNVLRQLLYRTDLEQPDSGLAVAAAFTWLTRHPTAANARYVLSQLLYRTDLGPQDNARAVAAAFAWLEVRPDAMEARSVLAPLLARTTRDAQYGRRAVAAAFTWLAGHPTAADAQSVLRPLLYRTRLKLLDSGPVVDAALVWLGRHDAAAQAWQVLRPLLRQADLDSRASARTVAAAFNWLEHHGPDMDAHYVLSALLSRMDLGSDDGRRALIYAFDWLGGHPSAAVARFVLQPLLDRTGLKLLDGRPVIAAALVWLKRHDTAELARLVLAPLLVQTDPGSRAGKQTVGAALAWLDKHGPDSDARFVLGPLLSRSDLGADESQRALIHAFAWLDPGHAPDKNAQDVLAPLLRRTGLAPHDVRQAVSLALGWLDDHVGAEGARSVLRSLLDRADLASPDAERAAVAAERIERHAIDMGSRAVPAPRPKPSGGAPRPPARPSPAMLDRRRQPGRQTPAGPNASNRRADPGSRGLGAPLSATPPDDSLRRYDLAIRTTRSPSTPPGLALNTIDIPWGFGADADPKTATVDALRSSGLALGDTAATIVFIAPPGTRGLPVYAAVVGFTHRWVDAYADGKVLELADSRWHEDAGEVVEPQSTLFWAQVGGPAVDGMLTVPFPPDPDARIDGYTAGVLRRAPRVRMVPPDSASAAFQMLVRVAALRPKRGRWRLPVLSTGTEPLPVGKSTQGQGFDLEVIRRAAHQYRSDVVKEVEEFDEIVPARTVSPLNVRIAEANAADRSAVLRRLGAAPVDDVRWSCPRDEEDHGILVMKEHGSGQVSCPRCYPQHPVGLVRLTMDTLLLTPDEAAVFILNDPGGSAGQSADTPADTDTDTDTDDFPTPGMAVTARVVGSTPDAYLCTLRHPVTGRDYEALLPMRELHKADPGLRLASGHTLVAMVSRRRDLTVLMESSAPENPAPALSVTAFALVERVLVGFVPELATGEVAIMKIARVPTAKTRIAVASTTPSKNAKGSFIGKGAERANGSSRLLSRGMAHEEIEIVPYSSDPRTMLTNAVAFIQPTDVLIEGKRAIVAVPEHQVRGSIGQDGLNARLAGQLTDLRVRIVPDGTDLGLAMESGLDEERARRDDLADI
ncbi:trypsin-like peptidase domain-containing protein [Catenulispora sp. NL8]|uniref:Trypsin-like peptidase domain-containing protein n=1 Tax=Catenulispora pinistramenti TaxID=2705254 RepID=A0ABS5KQ18_9ACTN|nr:trypsin-like peptidase domain-containing protein [Catenulispora pinistramenti]MBS2548146.1 trypsin-like peptidase domain-containing protein [Catenulispora pinistramenti]